MDEFFKNPDSPSETLDTLTKEKFGLKIKESSIGMKYSKPQELALLCDILADG